VIDRLPNTVAAAPRGNQHCLDQAIAFRDPALVHLAVAPDWDSLRGDPRFADITNPQLDFDALLKIRRNLMATRNE
jgi:hypothetical protein